MMNELVNVLREILHVLCEIKNELHQFNTSMPYFRKQVSRTEAIQEGRKQEKKIKTDALKALRKHNTTINHS